MRYTPLQSQIDYLKKIGVAFYGQNHGSKVISSASNEPVVSGINSSVEPITKVPVTTQSHTSGDDLVQFFLKLLKEIF